ncbi:hypothetical protein HPA02_02950 [Bisbaumannia pacifica]|uniref:Uncharacterized protein n=1 Tax=Bisbaumannia pacifica TaxID=77098 RepID=A0A510X3L6_9GAMM|nr:hypothetical protein [Halomonas pacifica]GEK46012.1 hypothetical protein HPA02_02950 [Halomonas pacifica]
MITTAQRPIADDINEMLVARNVELEQDKAKLAEQLEQAEDRIARLEAGMRRARIYAGEHMPTAFGTGIVLILESALKESS